MNKPYDEWSDFEINKRVAELLGYRVITEYSEHLGFTEKYHKDYPNTIWANKDMESPQEQFCFTGEWSDIGPIIEEYGINLNLMIMQSTGEKLWEAHSDNYNDGCNGITDKNPRRAAAIVFLQMKEGE